MATIITHGFTAYVFRSFFAKKSITPVVTACGIIMAMLPDADVLAFSFGIPYDHPLGHRGFTHSLLFAVFSAALVAYMLPGSRHEFKQRFIFLFISVASHGVLDAMTSGGLGTGFFIPFHNERYFFPFRPVLVSPIGLDRFLSDRGIAVLLSEFKWIWIPGIVIMAGKLLYRRRNHI